MASYFQIDNYPNCYSVITGISWHLKPAATELLTQQLAQANKKKTSNPKYPHNWPYARGILQWQINPLHEGPANAETLQWRHNGRDSISNHQPHGCLLKGLFRRRSKKTWKLHVTGLCAGNSPGTGEFPAQMASNTENVFIWWCHHGVQCHDIIMQLV